MTGDIDGRIEWTFEPTEGDTRVTYAVSYDLGLPSLLAPLFAPLADRFNRRELEMTLENLAHRMRSERSFDG